MITTYTDVCTLISGQYLGLLVFSKQVVIENGSEQQLLMDAFIGPPRQNGGVDTNTLGLTARQYICLNGGSKNVSRDTLAESHDALCRSYDC